MHRCVSNGKHFIVRRWLVLCLPTINNGEDLMGGCVCGGGGGSGYMPHPLLIKFWPGISSILFVSKVSE